MPPEVRSPSSPAPAYPHDVDTAFHKKAIDHPTDPSRNHPIHDAVEIVTYGDGRYVVGLTLDGVSETKSDKKLVPIGRMLAWDFARFCTDECPATVEQMTAWFARAADDPRYQGQGATTVAVTRFDRRDGIIDGLNLGDSVTLMVIEQTLGRRDGSLSQERRGVVLAPLHSVANDPGTVYKVWRAGGPFEPDTFRIGLPARYDTVYLVGMTDGYAKVPDRKAKELYDYRRAEIILAQRYPEYVRVWVPEHLMALAPGLRRPKNGRIRQVSVNQHPDLVEALRRYGREQATPEEKLQMVRVDLDTGLLLTLVAAREGSYRKFLDQPVGEALKASHRTLTWLTRAPLHPKLDDHGIEGWLRQYVMAELFAESMLQRVGRTRGDYEGMNQRLRDFFDWLGQIADDFATSILAIHDAPRGDAGHFEEEEGTLPEGRLF